MTRLAAGWLTTLMLFAGPAFAQPMDEPEEDDDEVGAPEAAPNAPTSAGNAVSPATPAPSFNTGSRMSAQDAQAVIDHHNRARADVGVAALAWSPEVAGYAQQWTDQLARNGCGFAHRSPNRYGENIFMGTAGAYHALDGSKNWESEKKFWRGGAINNGNFQQVGHYTQMVWRETRRFGCGESTCNGQLIVACNYDPAGNMSGQAPY